MVTNKKGRSSFLLVLASTSIALILVEIFLNRFAPNSWRTERYFRHNDIFQWNETFVRFDSELGFFPKPHLNAPFENVEFKTTVRTNSWGFRDDEESLENPEILVLGDSFAFGWGVEEDETAAAILEQASGRKVLNMGVSGYGTIQQVLLLQRYCEVESVTGATVVFQYYLNNRFENFQPPDGVWPTARKQGTRLVFTPANEDAFEELTESFRPSWKKWASRRSAVADLWVGLFWNPGSWEGFETRAEDDSDAEAPLGIPIGSYEVFEYLLRFLALYAQERSLDVRFVFVPFLDRYENPETAYDYSTEMNILEMLEIPYFEPGDRFGEDDFHRLDRHLNPEGHRKLGLALAEFLSGDANPVALASGSGSVAGGGP